MHRAFSAAVALEKANTNKITPLHCRHFNTLNLHFTK